MNSLKTDTSEAMTKIVQGVIRLAPFGILGLVAETFAETGFIPHLRLWKVVSDSCRNDGVCSTCA